ncbi:MAG: hypothetical protein QMD46_08445 [Methanomicrobiales archaeon]|nr:hypothetical protein [Methanomicrobiales archaeon]
MDISAAYTDSGTRGDSEARAAGVEARNQEHQGRYPLRVLHRELQGRGCPRRRARDRDPGDARSVQPAGMGLRAAMDASSGRGVQR